MLRLYRIMLRHLSSFVILILCCEGNSHERGYQWVELHRVYSECEENAYKTISSKSCIDVIPKNEVKHVVAGGCHGLRPSVNAIECETQRNEEILGPNALDLVNRFGHRILSKLWSSKC
jgi:hypothetical protein